RARRGAADQRDRRRAPRLSHRHGRAVFRPGMEAPAQPLPPGEPAGDRRAPAGLRRAAARRGQSADRRPGAVEITMFRLVGVLVLGFSTLPHGPGGGQTAAAPDPAGYQRKSYRSPTPAPLKGATVLTTQEAEAAWKTGAAFVDVIPRPPRPANLPV